MVVYLPLDVKQSCAGPSPQEDGQQHERQGGGKEEKIMGLLRAIEEVPWWGLESQQASYTSGPAN